MQSASETQDLSASMSVLRRETDRREEGWDENSDLTQDLSDPPPHLIPFLLPFQDDSNSTLLNNYVLGAQLDHRAVNNLQNPVNISFWHNRSLVLLGPPPPQPLKLSCQPPVWPS